MHEAEREPGRLFAESVAIIRRLRDPGGCPWDREQTFDSIRRYTLEETYEVLDAIERRHWGDLAEELGDLLLQVLFYAQIADDAGHFTIADVLDHLNRKLVRRHPHVFGKAAAAAAGNTATVDTATESAQVLRNWEAIKRAERAGRASELPANEAPSLLESVPKAFPALLEATKLGTKAAKAGFDWPNAAGLFQKIEEECRELEAEIAPAAGAGSRSEAAEGEMGDLLFTAVNLARHLGIDPELALKRTTGKFRRRFRAMEIAAAGTGRPLEAHTAEEMEALWAAAKLTEEAPA